MKLNRLTSIIILKGGGEIIDEGVSMSMDYSDIWDLGMESDCCGAGVYLNGICSYCNDHFTQVDEEE